jgi:hypothetical protein
VKLIGGGLHRHRRLQFHSLKFVKLYRSPLGFGSASIAMPVFRVGPKMLQWTTIDPMQQLSLDELVCRSSLRQLQRHWHSSVLLN